MTLLTCQQLSAVPALTCGSQLSCWYKALAAAAGCVLPLKTNMAALQQHMHPHEGAGDCGHVLFALRAHDTAQSCDVTLSIGSVVCWLCF